MKKFLILIFFTVIFSNFLKAEIIDSVNFFEEKDRNILEERLKTIENNYKVNFQIIIKEKDADITENSLNNGKKNVIIILEKEEEKRLSVKLKFSKEIDIIGYGDEIDDILNKLETLVEKKDYLDFIYELTGNVSDIINTMDIEKNRIDRDEKFNKIRYMLLTVFISLFFVLFVLVIFLRLRKIINKKNKICKNCKIEMQLVDEIEEDEQIIKLYNCRICGYAKRIKTNKK